MWMNYFEQKLKKKLKDLDKQHTLELDALFQKEKKNGRDMVLVVESPQLDRSNADMAISNLQDSSHIESKH